MNAIHVSVVVMEQSRVLESELLREEIPLLTEEADEFRENLKKWLGEFPSPGQPRQDVDRASELAVELGQILRPRDPLTFSEFYVDREGDTAMIERRPYNWANL